LRTKRTFDRLLSPGVLGHLTLANRVILPAMDMNLCVEGVIGDQDVDHYAARAAGGVGMIITSACAVAFPVGATSRKEPGLSDDAFIPGLRKLADAVHAAGSLLCVQATHHGKMAKIDMADERPLLVPSVPQHARDMSALRDNTPGELAAMAAVNDGKAPTYHEATEDDITWLIAQFAEASRRVMAAGADAIEVHCAHGYVLGGFLSRADNRRTDAWGGSLENRARLTCEVVRAIRREVGDRLAILVRVAGEEFGDEDALTTAETVQAARLFEAAGADAIHVTAWARNPFRDFTQGPLPDRVGAYVDYARQVKAAVDIPVIAVGRILPEVGEDLLSSGGADFIAMGRQLLADPDLVNKLKSGRPETVRPCINCYVCVEQNFWDGVPVCAVNPALGDEQAAEFQPASRAHHVVVVGGGPAGMESARVARMRGHRVTLLESSDRLGGSAWFSQLTTPANGPLLDWQQQELERLGVTVERRHRATADSVVGLRPDSVILATGAQRGVPDVPGADLPHVHTGDSLRALITGEAGSTRGGGGVLRLLGAAGRLTGMTRHPALLRRVTKKILPVGKTVVVIGGTLVGLELAEFLAQRGKQVTLIEPGPHVGLPMAIPRRWTAVRRAGEHDVKILRNAVVEEITPTEVRYRHEGLVASAPAHLVVVASHIDSGSPLAETLAERGLDVRTVGDADDVGYIQGAIHSAWRVARDV
jgi:2,4-dienoyl-CoA reductase-like NADH-dependent reductase (Old Yellow Enzyme family)/thioredoxin reductase